jgi:hypothetical protein
MSRGPPSRSAIEADAHTCARLARSQTRNTISKMRVLQIGRHFILGEWLFLVAVGLGITLRMKEKPGPAVTCPTRRTSATAEEASDCRIPCQPNPRLLVTGREW